MYHICSKLHKNWPTEARFFKKLCVNMGLNALHHCTNAAYDGFNVTIKVDKVALLL